MQRIKTLRRQLLSALTLSAITALIPAVSHAAYPEQPIKMVVAYGAGGGTDIIARTMALYISKHLGNNAAIVVTNRPGAGGAIGFVELARAPADGYTIGFINTPNVLTIPIERKSSFHWQDFELLGNAVDDPGNFSVHADSPHKNLKELVAFAKANPGAVTYGTTGIGSDDHISALLLERDSARGEVAALTDEKTRLVSEAEAMTLALARARDEIDAGAEAARLAAARRAALEALLADLRQKGADDAAALKRARDWWGGNGATPVTSIYDGTSSSAFLTGLMWMSLNQECPNAEYTGIAMEYGTLPMTEVSQALRAEHWLNNHPETAAAQAAQIKQQLMDAFYTDTDSWKGQIVSQARQAMFQAVDGLSG